ncbi:MAG: rod shape-determining protein RodA [Christensenellales bacterium]
MLFGLVEKKNYKDFDWTLMIIVGLILIYGLIILTNATSAPFTGSESGLGDIMAKLDLTTIGLQAMWIAVGLIGMFILTVFDYELFSDMSKILYFITIGLLLLLFVAGKVTRGVQGWFSFGERGLQPAELAKIIIIIIVAKITVKRSSPEGRLNRVLDVGTVLLYIVPPVGLVMLQPDWGTAFVYIVITIGIMFAAKMSYKILGGLLALGAGGIIIAYQFLMDEWQQKRILTFFDPKLDLTGSGMHVAQSKIVIGSGQMLGKGLFQEGTLSQMGYLYEQQTDFIYASAAETFGFVGGLVLILLYVALILRMIYLATQAKDRLGMLMITGVACMYMAHIFENIGMTMGLMPVTGIPLPFVSYGGSSMLTNMLGLGLVQSIAMRRGPKRRREINMTALN